MVDSLRACISMQHWIEMQYYSLVLCIFAISTAYKGSTPMTSRLLAATFVGSTKTDSSAGSGRTVANAQL